MSRGAFEAWYDKNHWSMLTTPKEDVALIWQAAQDDAFERAARVCLDQTRNLKDTKYVRRNAKRNLYLWRCAETIRALAKEPKQ